MSSSPATRVDPGAQTPGYGDAETPPYRTPLPHSLPTDETTGPYNPSTPGVSPLSEVRDDLSEPEINKPSTATTTQRTNTTATSINNVTASMAHTKLQFAADDDMSSFFAKPTTPAPASSTEKGTAKPKRSSKKRVRSGLSDTDSDDPDNAGSASTRPAKKSKKYQPVPESQRLRAAAKNGITPSTPIPSTLSECSEADRQLLSLRSAGESWPRITAIYTSLTGRSVGKSTLPNRYYRLKEKFSAIREEDNARIVAAKKEVDEEFERVRWGRVKERVVAMGGGSYEERVLKRHYHLLVGKGAVDVVDTNASGAGGVGGAGAGAGMGDGGDGDGDVDVDDASQE